MKRNLQLYKITIEALLDIVTGRARIQLPEGCELAGFWDDPETETLVLRVYHPSFPHAPLHQQIRIGDLIVERWVTLPRGTVV